MRGVQPVAETGTLLDNRYRLDVEVRTRTGNALWRATDEVLGRTVGVRLVTDTTKQQFKALTAAVSRAGAVSDARWVRVLDLGSEASSEGLTAWVVSEWVEGRSLTSTVRGDPLRGPVATTMLLSCAQAVVAAQRAGAQHRALHPSEVVIPPDGPPRLAGLEIAAALYAADRKTSTPPDYDDVRGLGGLLFAALTGRWPLAGWDGLPRPSRGDGLHPRQARGGISRELDEVTARALSGGYSDASRLVRDLDALPRTPLRPVPVSDDDRAGQAWRRWAWRVVPPVLVAGVGVGCWFVGSDLGRVPSPARALAPSFPHPHQRGNGGAQQVVWAKPPHVTSFDPEGDGAEDPGGVGLAVDDDPSTQWSTDVYRNNPRLGGLKTGVGLLLDLGRPKSVSVAQLLLSAPGANFEIRAGTHPPQRATDLPVVASSTSSPAAANLTLAHPTRARYWLVWFTSLPKTGSGYQLGVEEIALEN
jgi:hypothetical protein